MAFLPLVRPPRRAVHVALPDDVPSRAFLPEPVEFAPKVEVDEARRERIRRAFQGLDKPSPNLTSKYNRSRPKQERARFSNIAYLADVYKLPTKQVAKIYDTFRGFAAKDIFNTLEDPGDEGFYGLVSERFQWEDDVRAESEKAARFAAAKALTTPFIEAPDGERRNIPWTVAYSEFQAQRDAPKHVDSKAEKIYQQVFRQAYESKTIEAEPVRAFGKKLLQVLEADPSLRSEQRLDSIPVELLESLEIMTPEERQEVYAFIGANVDLGLIDESWVENTKKTLFRSIAVPVGRFRQSMIGSRVANIRGAPDADLVLLEPLSEDDAPEDVIAKAATMSALDRVLYPFADKATPQEAARIREAADKAQVRRDIRSELRDIRQHATNPVKTSSGFAGKIWYPAMDQIGFMMTAAHPLTMGAFVGVNSDMRREELVRLGVPDEAARNIGILSSLAEFPMERLQVKMLLGKPFGRAFGKWQLDLKKKLGGMGVFGANLSSQLIIQNAQELGQDMMPFVMQSLTRRLNEEIPEVQWGGDDGVLADLKGSRMDTFLALLPFAALGAGVGTARDISSIRHIMDDAARIEAMGVSKADAENIAKLSRVDPSEAVKEFQKVEKTKPNVEPFNEEAKRVDEMLVSPERPQITVLDDGRAEIEFEDGSTSIVADAETAHQAVQDTIDTRVEEARKSMLELQKNFEETTKTKFVKDDKVQTLENVFQEGIASAEQVRQRIQDLAVESGNEFGNNAFSQFRVYAQNEAQFRNGVFENVVRLFKGENPFAVVEDVSEGFWKKWAAEGEAGKIAGWLQEYQNLSGDQVAAGIADIDIAQLEQDVATGDLENSADFGKLIEAASALSTAYFSGKVQESSLSNGIKKLFQQLATYFQYVFDRATRLQKAFDGGLSLEFENRIAESVGLPTKRVDPARETKNVRRTLVRAKKKFNEENGLEDDAIFPSTFSVAPSESEAIRSAYRKLLPNTMGTFVDISALSRESGVSLSNVHSFLLDEARNERAELSVGDWPSSSPDQRSGVLELGGRKFIMAKLDESTPPPEQVQASPQTVSAPEVSIGDSIRSAYSRLLPETMGSFVDISALARESGASLTEVHGFLRVEARNERVELSVGDWASSSPEQRSGVLELGGRKFILAKLTGLPDTFSATPGRLEEALEGFFNPPDFRLEAYEKLQNRLRKINTRMRNKRIEAEEKGRDVSPLDVIEAIAQMEAILSALPVSVRGKVKGFTTLSEKTTDRGRLTYLIDRMNRADAVLDEFIADDKRTKLRALLKRSMPKKVSGKLKSSLGPEMARFVQEVAKAVDMSAEDVDTFLTNANRMVPDDLADISLAIEKETIVELFGNLDGMDAMQAERALDQLREAISEGRAAFKMKQEARQNQIQGMIGDALEGLKAPAQPDPEAVDRSIIEERTYLGDIASLAKNFLVEHLSWGQTLVTIFGAGKTMLHFEKQGLKAKNDFIDANLKRREEMQDWMAENLGLEKPRHQYRWLTDLKRVQEEKTGVFRDDGSEMALSQDEAIYFTMVWDQEQYQKNLAEKSGINAGTIAQMEEFLTMEARQFRAFLRKQYDKEYDRINKVYRELHGVDMPRVNEYAPVSIDLGEGRNMDTDPTDTNMFLTGLSAGSTKLRTKHNFPVKRQGASVMYWAHNQAANYYVSHAQFARDAKQVLLDKAVVAGIKSKKEPRRVKVLSTWIEQHHTNGLRRGAGILAAETLLTRLNKTNVLVGLAFNIGSMMKQFSAAGASLADVPAVGWARGFGSLMFNPKRWVKMYESPTMQRRVMNGMSVEMQEALTAVGRNPGILLNTLKTGLQMIGVTDAALTSISAAIAYDHHLRQARKVISDPVLQEQMAMEAVDRTVARTAQPTSNVDRSIREIIADSHPLLRLYIMFKSEMRQKAAVTIMGVRDVIKGETFADRAAGARAAATMWIMLPMMTHIVTELYAETFRDDDEDDGFWDRLTDTDKIFHRMLAGQSAGMFYIGEAMETASAMAFDQETWLTTDNHMLQGIANLFSVTGDILDGEFMQGEDAFFEANKAGRAVSNVLGALDTRAAAAGVVTRMARDVAAGIQVDGNDVASVVGAGPTPLEARLAEIKDSQDIISGARSEIAAERREREAAAQRALPKEERDLLKIFDTLRKLQVGTGHRARGIHTFLQSLPEDQRAAMRKRLKDEKILSTNTLKQLRKLEQ